MGWNGLTDMKNENKEMKNVSRESEWSVEMVVRINLKL